MHDNPDIRERHGGNIYGVREGVTDFSANISPLGMPDEVRRAAEDAVMRSDLLQRSTEIFPVFLDKTGIFFQRIMQKIEERGFQSAEAVIIPLDMRFAENKPFGVAQSGKLIYHRSAGISQSHYLRALVERLAGSIVDDLSDDYHLAIAIHPNNLQISVPDSISP